MKYSNIVILWKTSYAENFPSICRERARKKKEEEERRMEREREKVWFQLSFLHEHIFKQQQQQQHSLFSQASWGRLEMKPERNKFKVQAH